MITLWGRENSINVQKALWCLEELGRPFQRIDAGGAFGGLDTPAYRALNPNGLVPTLQEGDFVLWESNAIVRYLATAYGPGQLVAADPQAAACADQWLEWQTSTLWPALRTAYFQIYRTAPAAQDPRLIAESASRTAAALELVEARLAQRPWLAGNAFSYGDIGVALVVYRWRKCPLARPEFPHLAAWYERLLSRPAFRRIDSLPLS